MQNDDVKQRLPARGKKQIDKKIFLLKGEIPVRTDAEEEYLLKAVDAFKRRLCVISPDFQILAVNLTTDVAVGSDIIGQHCYEVFYDRSTPCKNCAVTEAVKTKRPALRPKIDDAMDLGMLPCLYSYPIISDGKIDAMVSMDFDLPTQSGLQEKLERSNAFLQNLILSAVNGVIAADRKGKILFFNDVASDLLGYSVEEALNDLNIRDIYPGDGAYEVMEKLRSEEYGNRGKLISYFVDVASKNGATIPISLNASIVYEGGLEIATIGFFHDLRKELQLKEELEKTRIQLFQAEKMSSLGKLAAGVAHQLNNPLGGITLYAKLMMEDYELEEGAREDLHRILKDAERGRDIVKELLEFTRQTRQLMRPNDINHAITRTLFLLENQALFQNIKIVTNLSSAIPPVYSDIQQLNHMFMNIILNSVQAMDGNGELTVKTYNSTNENWVCIEFSDTGPGIPKDVLPHVFEPFFTTKEEGQGTGLGLSLVYSIVENHGGNIKAWNTPGNGATFRIDLPLQNTDSGDHQDGK
jgi:PAS domain S-box-containing protein